ncbi:MULTISPECIES: NAD(P)-dependent oxidoreductase [Prauserella salsuginis group]|uniref:3-hydroxyisobutyrate dehydrogenase n=2 Tax=Prauserella salsuginis group TaxID=2893672 RepID=A0A839XT61_9PSEU|nr:MULTISPECIES: NAD(P)-dependent oxidoreductase [Prauserella salsuginis group]MBB3664198.1 3-hydroxyisobutyrate dehydrogenase [Prauserella sediminis]MCR3721648.1 3-hydroxyisobutyrate dehydrogenase [Prauserella flava]MCR3734340.1 3-hydroxyisobutyrate dehydrogenase [Prauserella salsuginis]
MRIAFIGAGNMGGAVARRLATGGYDVRVADTSPSAVERCTAVGAEAAESAAAAAKDADVVFTSLPTPEVVTEVWREVAPHLSGTAIAVDVSTIDPATADQLETMLAEHGHAFVHCALGKTPAAAEQGAIPLFAGGSGAAITTLAPVFDRMGERTYDFGSPSAAAVFKLISNMIGMTNVAVLSEGFTLAEKAGIDPELFASALDDTGAYSFQSQVRLPWMIAGDDTARFSTALAAKDLRLAVDAAGRLGIPTPVSAQTLAQLLSTVVHGYGDRDVVAMRSLLTPPGRD